jgi:hypothetical protein
MNQTINYHGMRFRSVANVASGDVGAGTYFDYYQEGNLVWADYAGGSVRKGHLIAVADQDGNLDMRYQHLDRTGRLKTGVCTSRPEITANGIIRLHESWQWTCDDHSRGTSIIEQVP